MTIIQNKNFKYELNNKNLTAKLLMAYSYPNAVIPRSVIYQSQEYIITEIGEKAVGEYFRVITFPKDCQILSFSKESFHWSHINEITIPASVKELKAGWNFESHLIHVKIDPKNKYLKMIDNKMIIGKSDPNSENFDILISSVLNICHANVPSYIKQIAPCCFANTKNLLEINFQDDSELLSISENAFIGSSLKHISFPPKLQHLADGWCNSMDKLIFFSVNPKNEKFTSIDHKMIVAKSDLKSDDYDILVIVNSKIKEFTVPSNIKHISSFCFTNCKHLKTVIFPENSELLSIGKNAFSNTLIESISFPAKLRNLSDSWSDQALNLKTVFLSHSNQCLKLINNDLLVGKTDQNKEYDDILFFANRSIKEATIPSSIEFIASHCFEDCKYLKNVQIPNDSKLKKIGNFAFNKSAISEINIPVHVKIIGKFCFGYCASLKNVTFANNSELVVIDDNAFSHSAITKLEIPKQVESIGKQCFHECTKLIEVKLPSDLKIEIINYQTFHKTSIKSIFIPKNVKKIDKSSFHGCLSLEEIEFDEDSQLVSIGNSSFCQTAIKSICIPKHTKFIDRYAFQSCLKLKDVKFTENSELEIIENSAFVLTDIKEIFIPESIKRIEECFMNPIILRNIDSLPVFNESTKKFEVPSDKKYLTIGNFRIIPLLIKSKNINSCAIHGDLVVSKSNINSDEYDVLIGPLKEIDKLYVPSYIKHISDDCFKEFSSLKFIFFPQDSQLLTIGKNAFEYTEISSIYIPQHVQVIDESAFNKCFKLKSVEFSQNSELQSLKPNSFNISITEVFIPQYVKEIRPYLVFDMKNINKFEISPNNKNFLIIDEKIIIGKSNQDIDEFDTLIYVNGDIEKIIIPSYIKFIDPYCFYKKNSLLNVEFTDDSQLVSIGDFSFMETSIKTITIPSSVRNIGISAFDSCTNLETVYLPENSNLESISDKAFHNASIVEINVPKKVKKIGQSCFSKTLKTINFRENSELEYIDDKAFEMTSIENIIIPSSVYYIGENAFYRCQKIQTFSFQKNSILESFDDKLFRNTSIQKLIIPANVKIIHSYAICSCSIDSLEFEDNSNLFLFEKDSIQSTTIQIFQIPEKATFSHGCFNSSKINKFIKYLNNNNVKILNDRLIIGKSQKNYDDDDFDVLIYGNTDTDTVIIPSYIRKISKYCFECLLKLKHVRFDEDSKLVSIGQHAFQFTLIEKIILPKHVKILKTQSFYLCKELKEFIIPEDSELEIIEKEAINLTKINHLFIPSKVKKIDLEEFHNNYLISITISPQNKNFQSINNNRIVIGKSQPNIDCFDTLLLICSSVKTLKVPSFIKYIGNCCASVKKIHTIEFTNDSQLVSIGKNSLRALLIEKISIPSSCVSICENAFNSCKFLKKISFAHDSKLQYIEESAFSHTPLVSICIPKNVKSFRLNAFRDCYNLHSIELLGDNIEFIDEKNKGLHNLQLISCPNATQVYYSNFSSYEKECFLLINAGAKIILTK